MVDEKRIAEIMKSLDLTRDEVLEMLADDDDIDHDKPKDFDLSKDKQKIVAQYTRTTSGKKQTRTVTHKDDFDKQDLIETIAKALDTTVENLAIANKEREITFSFNGAEYSVTLTKHRPPKAKKGS